MVSSTTLEMSGTRPIVQLRSKLLTSFSILTRPASGVLPIAVPRYRRCRENFSSVPGTNLELLQLVDEVVPDPPSTVSAVRVRLLRDEDTRQLTLPFDAVFVLKYLLSRRGLVMPSGHPQASIFHQANFGPANKHTKNLATSLLIDVAFRLPVYRV